MSKKRNREMDESERLESKWESLVDSCQDYGYSLDIEDVKKLIFDTYVYFSLFSQDDHLKKNDLKIYRCMSQFLRTEYYPKGWMMSEFDTVLDFVAGQCCILEEGIETFTFDGDLPLMNLDHIPAGCQQPSADMFCYESFERTFNEYVDILMEDYEEEPGEDILEQHIVRKSIG